MAITAEKTGNWELLQLHNQSILSTKISKNNTFTMKNEFRQKMVHDLASLQAGCCKSDL